LIIDEFWPWDAEFQKKAIGKMQDISRQGVELCFCAIIWQLSRVCTRGIVMEHGKIVYDGEIVNAVSHYLGVIQRV
jgi:lipopolysaccharide transport system ATP-binding protein